MRIPVALASLYAARSALDVAILAAEQDAGIGEPQKAPGSCPNCGASDEQQENTSTLDGTQRRRCKACRHDWEPA